MIQSDLLQFTINTVKSKHFSIFEARDVRLNMPYKHTNIPVDLLYIWSAVGSAAGLKRFLSAAVI